MKKALIGCLLIVFLAFPPIRHGMESNMLTQMYLQMLGLMIAGWLFRDLFQVHWPKWLTGFNKNGVSGILLCFFLFMFWMLPRSIDAAIGNPTMEVAKYLTLPLLTGLPFGLSWPKFDSFWKNFILANFVSMTVVMGWLYLASPVRLCNNFLASQQEELGWSLIGLTLLAILYWVAPAFKLKDMPSE